MLGLTSTGSTAMAMTLTEGLDWLNGVEPAKELRWDD